VICVLGDAHLDVIVSLAGPIQPETDGLARIGRAVGRWFSRMFHLPQPRQTVRL